MTKLLTTVALVLISAQAYAVPVAINRRDVKFPTQQMVEKQTFTNPAAAGANDVLNDSPGPTSASAASVTTFSAQPDVARNLVVVAGDTTGDIEACQVTITGTNYLGASMSEVYYFSANQTSSITGVLAFKTVTSVAWSANCESGGFAASWSVGYGERLGLKRCVDSAGHFLFSTLNGAKEGTAPTLTVGASVQINTADFNGAMNGANDFELFFFQNYTCF